MVVAVTGYAAPEYLVLPLVSRGDQIRIGESWHDVTDVRPCAVPAHGQHCTDLTLNGIRLHRDLSSQLWVRHPVIASLREPWRPWWW